jgi:hypothetical protein
MLELCRFQLALLASFAPVFAFNYFFESFESGVCGVSCLEIFAWMKIVNP